MRRKVAKYLLVSVLLFFMIISTGLVYFFYANDAPITKGQISYGVTYKGDLSLDIYHPTKLVHEKSPVVLFVHGGAWIAGRKESMNTNRVNGAVNQLRDHGYTIISIEYTLARNGKSPFPTCIADGFDAIQWISDRADSLNLDLDYFGIMGESAGAHIAMMNVFSNPSDFGLTHEKTALDYVVDIYGPNDLYKLYRSESLDSLMAMIKELPKPINQHLNLANKVFGFDPEEDLEKTKTVADLYSPVTYLKKNLPPVLIIHGNKDQIVPLDQSTSLKLLLDSLEVENEMHILEHTNHAFIGADDSQKSDVQDWIFNFIENQRIELRKDASIIN
ncbi:MAG: alpha/beta hydrolase [Reichenbachiella sp.]|uniref:alpha/beta hydrolase n=1 Tax=Reichenbachiella sp. TaxID=2184521 RepID=UPI003266FAB5